MSIATQIIRIESNRNTIRDKLVELGMATTTDKLDTLAAAIENLVNRGAVSVTVQEGDTYTIPAGYHNGSGTVSGVKGGGNYNLQSKTATPTKKQQSITPDSGYYGLSDVTVSPIPDAYQDVSSVTAGAGDVLTGKVYVLADGTVTIGTMPNNGAVSKALDVTTITYTIPKGHHNGTGKVSIVLETKTVTPTKAEQKITPTGGKVLGEVVVNPIPDKYQDVSDVTATAEKVLAGSKFVDAEGNEVEGAMVDYTNAESIAPLSVERSSYTIPEGYHDGKQTIHVARGGVAYATPSKKRQVIEGSYVDNGEGNLSHHSFNERVIVEPIPDKYQDVSGVTVSPNDVLETKYYVNKYGYLGEGTMPNNGSMTKTLDGMTTTAVEIPEGYTIGGTVSLTSDIEDALAVI